MICNFKKQEMIKQFLFSIGLGLTISNISCIRENKPKLAIAGAERADKIINKNIRFSFSAARINSFKETVEINASLFNNNEDTVYFLSSTCEGIQYSLRYDTSKFVLTPFLNCYFSSPIIIKVLPKGRYDFKAHFRASTKETKIKLGLDFYSVDKSYNLTNKNLGDIFNRQKEEQTIIWAEEKKIS